MLQERKKARCCNIVSASENKLNMGLSKSARVQLLFRYSYCPRMTPIGFLHHPKMSPSKQAKWIQGNVANLSKSFLFCLFADSFLISKARKKYFLVLFETFLAIAYLSFLRSFCCQRAAGLPSALTRPEGATGCHSPPSCSQRSREETVITLLSRST